MLSAMKLYYFSMKILVLGHVDSGKSTVTVYMIRKCDEIDKIKIDKWENATQKMGETSMGYCWVVDKVKAEKKRIIVNDTAPRKFRTRGYDVTPIESPWHGDFIKEIITGTIQVDCALLIISAKEGEFDIPNIIQTKKDALLAYTLGVKQMIVGINKMDSTFPPFDVSRFNLIKKEVSKYLETIGYQPDSVAFVPISGQDGDNMVDPNVKIGWYTGWEVKREVNGEKIVVNGLTLIEALDSIQRPFKQEEKPLRLPVEESRNIKNKNKKINKINTICSVKGRVDTGIIKSGMEVTFAPQDLTVMVDSVNWCKSLSYACVNIKNVSMENIRRGTVCSDANNDPARESIDFTALVLMLDIEGKIPVGYKAMVKCHTASIKCTYSEFLEKIDRETGITIEDSPQYLESGDLAVIKIIPSEPMCVETFAEYPPLGRIDGRDINNQTNLIGVIQSVNKKAFERKPIRHLQCAFYLELLRELQKQKSSFDFS